MKKTITLVLFLFSGLLSGAQNLVVNPGLEAWEKISRPMGWSHVENCIKDSAFVHSGSYSCRHAGGTTTSDLGQTIPVFPGKNYMLSLFYFTGEPTTGNGSRIWCYWKDAAGASISDPATDDIMRPSGYLKSSAWEVFTINVTAPPAAAAFYLELRTNTGSLMYWDDITFEEIIISGSENTGINDPLLYPNPAKEILIIRNLAGIHHIGIQDMNGITLKNFELRGEPEITIPLYELRNGMYILRLYCKGKIITRKFIKT